MQQLKVAYRESNIQDIMRRITSVFNNKTYLQDLKSANKNWTDYSDETVIDEVKMFISKL